MNKGASLTPADAPLTHKQEMFVLYYIEHGDGQKAAIQAGYSPKSAACIASGLLAKANIKARLNAVTARIEDKHVMSVQRRKERLSEFAAANLVDFLDEAGAVDLKKDSKNAGAVSEYQTVTRYGKDGTPTVTKRLKLVSPIEAIGELNKMDRVYDTTQTVNNNTVVFVIGRGYQNDRKVIDAER